MTPNDELDITSESNATKGVTILHLDGSLDSHTFQMLEKAVEKQFESACYRLIFDLSKLDYISSAGCGQFVAAMSEALAHDGMIVLLSPNAMVDDVLKMVGLIELLPVAADLNEALAKFK